MKKTLIVLMMAIVAVSLFVGCKNEPEAKTYNVGDTIELGSKDGKAITWLVLDIDTEDNTALLISKDILESSQFGGSNAYKDSPIRTRLNGDFITAYGLDKSYMVKVDVTTAIEKTEKNTGDDHVFLLSNTEYGKYKDTIATHSSGWWLRTPKSDDSVLVVQTNGSVNAEYVKYSPYTGGIRPAFWCKLSEINN